MIKRTATLIIVTFLLSAVTAFAAPSADFIFYDDTDGLCYVFGKLDKNADDAGVIIGGKKYSYKLDEDDSDSRFSDALKKDTPTYGIAFKAPRSYFNEFVTTPYSVSDNKDVYGITRNFDGRKNEIKYDYLCYEDFTSETLPAYITDVSSKYGELSIENTEGSNKLKFVDPGAGAYAGVRVDVPEYDDIITFEMRFKLTKTTTDGYGFIINFLGSDSNRAFRIIKYTAPTDTLCFVNSGTNNSLMGKIDMNGEWYTLKVKMDTCLKISDVSVSNDIYKEDDITASNETYVWQDKNNGRMISYNQSWISDYSGGDITDIEILNYSSTAGECLIDYIALYEYDESFKEERIRAQSKDIKTYSDPVIRLVPNKSNIIYNGEVMYSVYEPVIKDNVILVEAETIADILDMDFTDNKTYYTFKKGVHTFKFNPDGNSYYYNEREKSLSAPLFTEDDALYIPLCDIIKYLNTRMEFKEDENVLYINNNISVDLNKWLSDNSQYEDVLTVYTLEETRE